MYTASVTRSAVIQCVEDRTETHQDYPRVDYYYSSSTYTVLTIPMILMHLLHSQIYWLILHSMASIP